MLRFLLVLAAVSPTLALGWGFDGHRRLASRMQDPLPANHCLTQWFSSRQTTQLQDKSCDPDRWRNTSSGAAYDPDEWPRHFIDLDWVTPPSAYPRDFAQAVLLLGPRYATGNGTVPWRVEQVYGELVEAFRARDTTRILDRAFILSHYVTDSFSVLHNTKNADPNGLHSRWESDMLQNATRINGISTLAVSYYGTVGRADPRNNTFDIAIVGQGLSTQLINMDIAAGGDVVALYTASRDFTARRWGDALTVMASILWTAWADAGAPDLSGFSGACSRAVPTGEVVLVGFPPPGGFTHPDGGVAVDAGTGGGAGGGAGGGSGGSGGWSWSPPDAGVGQPPPPPLGCGCQGSPQVLLAALGAFVAFVARRRRR